MTRALPALTILLLSSVALAEDYVVLEAPSQDPGFHEAAARLAERRGGTVVPFDPAKPEALLPRLRKLAPRHVALVMPPDRIDFAFQRRFLEVATRVDDDPFADFAFGYVTGADGAEARAFVEACVKAAAAPREVTLGRLSGAAGKSRERTWRYSLRSEEMQARWGQAKGDDASHDREFVAAFLPKLAQCSVIQLVGHGHPDRVVGALDAADVAGLRLDGAVVLNVACWTGTTRRWFDVGADRRVVAEDVAAEKSLALAMLRTGLCGYTAYLCPRPAGPELDRDVMALVADGASLGDARRRDYDKTVLGFLGFGAERMELVPVAAGDRRPERLDAVRDVMLQDATGGVLFGDPALLPLVPLPDSDPIAVACAPSVDGFAVTFTCPRRSLWLHCVDPTARFDGGPAHKVYARVPLGDLPVGDVVVESARIGERDLPSRVVWAVEDDHGDRFLQLKVVLPRQDGREVAQDAALSVRVVILRARDARAGKSRGGDLAPGSANGGR